MSKTQKLTTAAVLTALAVVCSAFYIPVGASKCFPIQHMVNVLAGVFLGPWYGLAMAFVTSLIRVMMATGSLLAFPGSMIGAFLCGMVYRKYPHLIAAFLGEVVGTGILGAFVAYPMATLVMSKEAALFTYVLPFSVSSFGGALISVALVYALKKTKLFRGIGVQ